MKKYLESYNPKTLAVIRFLAHFHLLGSRIQVHVKETETEILLETEVPEGVEAAIDVSNLEAAGKKVVA